MPIVTADVGQVEGEQFAVGGGRRRRYPQGRGQGRGQGGGGQRQYDGRGPRR